MPVPTKTFGKGRSGVANVIISGERVHLTFEDNDQAITCFLSDAPSYIRQGRQAVTLNSNNTEIYGARPVGGTHRCIFAGFAAREGEPPTIREVAAKSGVSSKNKSYKIPAHLEFTALFDVIAGKWKNYRLVYNLNYNFSRYDPDDDADDASAITMITGEKLASFLEICGMDFDSDSIPWSDNVLVFLEKLLASRKRPVAISLNENGWVKDIGEIPEEDDDEPDQKTGEIAGGVSKEEEEKYAAELKKVKSSLAKEKEEQTSSADKIIDELTGSPPPAKKAQVAAPSLLQALFNNAKDGDTGALEMLTSLSNSGNKAAADFLSQLE